MHAPLPLRHLLLAAALVGAWIPAATLAAPRPQDVVRLAPVVVASPAPIPAPLPLPSGA